MGSVWKWILTLFFLSPVISLFLFPQTDTVLDGELVSEAWWNTGLLAFCVVLISSVVGVTMAVFHRFFVYPFKKTLHALLMLPLAFPAYVLAFLYLSSFSSGADYKGLMPFEMQGELWFLVFVLVFSLSPYIYFFSSIGLELVSQSEIETEMILGGGRWRFFKNNTLPKLLPFLVSAQLLVLFETLADFGAASMVNVPVFTTLIYKTWFDLFSFSGAAYLSVRYLIILFLFLFLEAWIQLRQDKIGQNTKTIEARQKLSLAQGLGFLVFSFLTVLFSFALPLGLLLKWSLGEWSFEKWQPVLKAAGQTTLLAMAVAFACVFISLLTSLIQRANKEKTNYLTTLSSLGYSIPGSVLAVAFYAMWLKIFGQLNTATMVLGLVVALSYKFITISFRSISESVQSLPRELDELSTIMDVGIWKKWTHFIFPYMRESLFVASLLVAIEVMKEMPLTLMLAPSSFQSLSIQIFNYTSEGEWEKAALPSLLLVVLGAISVTLLLTRKRSG